MKTVLILAGVIALLLLAVVGGYFGYLSYMGPKVDASCKAYVDDSIPAIVSGWSQDELLSRCTPDLNQAISGDKVTSLFKELSQLGSMQSYDGSQGQSHLRLSLHSGWVASATYNADASFEHGKVEFQLTLTQIHGQWYIAAFKVVPRPA